MAVSLCSDWGTMVMSNDVLDINVGFYQQHPPLATAPFGFLGTSPSTWDTYDPPLLEHLFNGSPNPDDYLLPDPSMDVHHLSSLLSSSSSSEASVAAFAPVNLCPAPTEFDAYNPSSLLFGATALGGGAACLEPQFLQSDFAFASPLENPEAMALQPPPPAAALGLSGAGVPYTGRTLASGVGSGAGVCPSAQSVAARQRRKRISEKTHELGQLVPGGSRMNTAEMLQAAFKYVKFLQAQVGILDLMRSSRAVSTEELHGSHHRLQALLASPAVQEKLASEERCVVPECMVRALLEDREIKSQPSMCRELLGLSSSMA